MIDPKALTQSILRMAATDNAAGIELTIAGLIEVVRDTEREACAKIADGWDSGDVVARVIRERSK